MGESVRFTIDDARAAADVWRFNCGPAALCAVIGWTPTEIRPWLLDFEKRGYTNPSLMAAILRSLRPYSRLVYNFPGVGVAPAGATYPSVGLVRVQWGGPWTAPGVPVRARYRHTHWIAVRGEEAKREAFDVNAMCVGGWIPFAEWFDQLVPWLLKQCEPRANGLWWPTHCWEVPRV